MKEGHSWKEATGGMTRKEEQRLNAKESHKFSQSLMISGYK
jgi:hypothetical protein